MYYIEFSLIRRDLYQMTQEQRVAHLAQIEKDQLEKRKAGDFKSPECVFPPWQQDLIKGLSRRCRYDPMNQILRAFFNTEEERAMAADRFERAYNIARLQPENLDFASKFQMNMGMMDNSFEAISIDEDLIEEMQFEAEERVAKKNLPKTPDWEEEAKFQNIKMIDEIPVKHRQLPAPGLGGPTVRQPLPPSTPLPNPNDPSNLRRPNVFVRIWRWIFGDPK